MAFYWSLSWWPIRYSYWSYIRSIDPIIWVLQEVVYGNTRHGSKLVPYFGWFFKTTSVGAISVAESDPNVIYVGMGEHAVRGVMTHHGDGMYKSTDAGKTWKR